MKKYLYMLFFVPFLIFTFHVQTADTQIDPGLIKWLQDHEATIKTNRQLINHEQQKRMELQNLLIKMLQNQNQNLSTHISNLEKRIRSLEIKIQDHEQAIKKLIQ